MINNFMIANDILKQQLITPLSQLEFVAFDLETTGLDAQVHKIIEQARSVARNILTKHKSKLILIAKELIIQETLESDDLEALFLLLGNPVGHAGDLGMNLPSSKLFIRDRLRQGQLQYPGAGNRHGTPLYLDDEVR